MLRLRTTAASSSKGEGAWNTASLIGGG